MTCDSAQMVIVSLLSLVFPSFKWEESYLQLWFSLACKAHSTWQHSFASLAHTAGSDHQSQTLSGLLVILLPPTTCIPVNLKAQFGECGSRK